MRLVQSKGETPLELQLSPEDAAAASGKKIKRPSIPRAELADLIRELATALEAGLPLMQALRTVRRQAASKALQTILDYIIERVESGVTLHQAAKEYGLPFDDMTIGMLRAADASGSLAASLGKLSKIFLPCSRSPEAMRQRAMPMMAFTLVASC